MRIINIIKDIHPVRMGVFTAATNTAPALFKHYAVRSEIWFPNTDHNQQFPAVENVSLKSSNIAILKKLIPERKLDPRSDIIVTHSPWNFQSAWGAYLAGLGFKWVFVPHGNLFECALSRKWLKKKLYLQLVEYRRLKAVSVHRAICTPEKYTLEKKFPGKEVSLIFNGFTNTYTEHTSHGVEKDHVIFLFMARLHEQKGVVPLIEAWISSSLNNNNRYKLVIAGPDDGELSKIQPLLGQSGNMEYAGAIYKEQKEAYFAKSTFFILPSSCEGFPVSILETACRGLVPVVSAACNFPELTAQQMAIPTGMHKESIKISLEVCGKLSSAEIENMSKKVKAYIENNYSLEIIAQQQFKLYSRLLGNNN